MAARDRDSSVGEDDSTAVPVAQSRIVTEVAPTGDPMASIRPQLPESPPLLAPTLELSGQFHGSAQPSEHEPTLEPHLAKRDQHGLPTHATGPMIGVIESDALAGQSHAPEAAAYQLRRQIGVGGMGEVWEAQQRELGRTVALKRLREGKQTPANVRLFKSEARLTAILDHPNIVTVHELGCDQAGRMFYTMKMIEGTPWSDVMAAGERRTGEGNIVKVELRDHLDILVEVSQAIAFAHSRGVIHRDIKPGNIMIGDYGDIQVVDWGLAVALYSLPALGRAETWTLADLPSSALVCGTPAYMSPETATAQRERIGTATDVYLLGAVLFHLLYGRPPHKGKSVDAVIAKAKVNAWVIPDDIPGRLRPWDALLRPVITQALASDPSDRYSDAEQFREALREAIRNYESAKVSSRAQEELAGMVELFAEKPPGTAAYQRLAAMIARLESALDSWPRNLAARQTLAQARLELARQALANGDLALAHMSLDAFDKLPTLPEPTMGRAIRRLTVHPADGTLVSAPRPTDSLVAAGTSNQWVSSAAELGRRTPSSSVARTIEADLARASEISESGPIQRSRTISTGVRMSAPASVEIQQESDEELLDEAEQLEVTAARLRMQLATRELSGRRRRISLWIAAGLIGVLGLTALYGQAAVYRERNRARAERDKLSKVLLDETANAVDAQLDVVFTPVDGALTTALAWARAGDLDLDDPAVLNRYYMPLLHGLEAATSTLRADTAGNEYMLLREGDGWRTRVTTPISGDFVYTIGQWSQAGKLLDEQRTGDLDYNPKDRRWYQGGVELRNQAKAAEPELVYWTPAYIFFTTQELGISVSAPATSPSGREFVLAFDLKLGDISSITSELPRDIDEGQVFVLDEQLQVLALPRETNGLSAERRKELLLDPMAELEDAPISSAAVREWQRLGDDGPFKLELGDGAEDNYWVGFRKVEKPRRPRVWIGVVVPESHFLE